MSENTGIPNVTSPTSVKLAAVVETHVEMFNADELAVLNASVVELQAYEELLAPVDGEATEAPVNVDVPYASQSGATLNCTMGNWDHEPTSYAYQWTIDGMDAGTEADLVITANEVGKTAACVVTASNAIGATAAPPSNWVTIADFSG